jgi:hypothetical protein
MPTFRGFLAGILAVLCTSILSSTPLQNPDSKFIVGVLQENGAIIPFARYDGTRWLNTWPAPAEESKNSSPPSLTRIPPEWLGGEAPQTWRLWLPVGTTHTIRATGPRYIKGPCGENWGLNTDFPQVLNQRANTCPLRAIGIVVSTNQLVLPMPPVSQSGIPLEALESAASESEVREMRQENEARARLLARGIPLSGLPWDVTSLIRIPMKVEHAWAAQKELGEGVIYIEANRRFESNPGCPQFSTFRGWMSRDSSGKDRVLGVTVRLTDCDFKEVAFNTPMGLLELKGGTFAVVQVNGWESQSYAILKISTAEVTTVLDSPVR